MFTRTYYKVSDNGFYTNQGKQKFVYEAEAIELAKELTKKYEHRQLPPISVVKFVEKEGENSSSVSRIEVWNAW